MLNIQNSNIHKKGLKAENAYYTALMGLFDQELFWDFVYSLSVKDYTYHIGCFYNKFLDGCLENQRKYLHDDKESFLYFNNVLKKFKTLKEKLFVEDDNKIYHSLSKKEISEMGDKVQQITSMHYFYINQIISDLEEFANTKKLDKSETTYKVSGFNVKNQDCLDDAYNQLIEFKIIAKDVLIHDFKTAFQGRIPENKIRWLQGPGLLSFFIKEINGIGILDTKKHIWDSTIACFVDKAGTPFEKTQLRHGKIPKNRDDIKKVIYTFNEDPYNDI